QTAREEERRSIRPTHLLGCKLVVARCLPCQLPEFSHKSDFPKHRFRFRSRVRTPLGTETVAIPQLRQLPSLSQRKRPAARTPPLATPAIHMLLRPEQEHCPSSERDVLVPLASRYRDVNEPLCVPQFARLHRNVHSQIAAAAGSPDFSVFAEHGRNPQSVPDAVSEPRTPPDGHRERGRNRGERSDTPEFSVFLQHERMALAQARQATPHLRNRTRYTPRHLRDRGTSPLSDHVAIDENPKLAIALLDFAV